jgi:uncharacterized protein (TIGR03118 family)
MTHRILPALLGSAALALALAPASAHAIVFDVVNLVSNGDVPAAHIDPNLINPWGVSYAPTSPFWISDNNSGFTSIKNGSGAVAFPTLPQVAFPAAASNPTGQVFNAGLANGAFQNGGHTPLFIFDGEDGHISTWSLANGGTAAIGYTSPNDSVFKGLAIATSGANTMLYATDFRNNAVDMFTNTLTGTPTTFTDTTVDRGYAPFNAQVLGGHLFVTFALQDAARHDDVSGAGNGYVDEFNLDGTFDQRIASVGDPNLDSPWGLALAPSNWGAFAGKLLVGNFGDGTISVFDQNTDAFLGKLEGRDHKPLFLRDLWALTPGNDHAAGLSSDIYFTAGLVDEGGGLFGRISVAPEPDAWLLMLAGFSLAGAALRARPSSRVPRTL